LGKRNEHKIDEDLGIGKK